MRALVRKDLIKNLSDNLVKEMGNVRLNSECFCNARLQRPDAARIYANSPDETRLAVLLDRYWRDELYKKNGYELMDIVTTPNKRVPDSPIFTIEQTGEFENWNDTKIAAWVDSVLSRYVAFSLLSE